MKSSKSSKYPSKFSGSEIIDEGVEVEGVGFLASCVSSFTVLDICYLFMSKFLMKLITSFSSGTLDHFASSCFPWHLALLS